MTSLRATMENIDRRVLECEQPSNPRVSRFVEQFDEEAYQLWQPSPTPEEPEAAQTNVERPHSSQRPANASITFPARTASLPIHPVENRNFAKTRWRRLCSRVSRNLKKRCNELSPASQEVGCEADEFLALADTPTHPSPAPIAESFCSSADSTQPLLAGSAQGRIFPLSTFENDAHADFYPQIQNRLDAADNWHHRTLTWVGGLSDEYNPEAYYDACVLAKDDGLVTYARGPHSKKYQVQISWEDPIDHSVVADFDCGLSEDIELADRVDTLVYEPLPRLGHPVSFMEHLAQRLGSDGSLTPGYMSAAQLSSYEMVVSIFSEALDYSDDQ